MIGINTAQSLTRKGMLHIYTGDGKGKSQAALGVVLRSIGLGIEKSPGRILLLRFLKGGDRAYSEDTPIHFLQAAYPHLLDEVRVGRGEFFTRERATMEDFKEASRGWAIALGALASGLYSLIVLDEICPILDLGLLPLNEVVTALGSHGDTEIICTGRNAPQMLLDIADLHSEIVPSGNGQTRLEIYDGSGKGKSTNALGRALKSVGECLQANDGSGVFLMQFLKGGTGYTEDAAIATLSQIAPEILRHERCGSDSIVWGGQQSERDYLEAERGWRMAIAAIESGKYRTVILDELNPVVDLELLPEMAIAPALTNSRGVDVIITGRTSRRFAYYDLAGIVSTVNARKHYADSGHKLRRGVDF